LSNVHRHWWHFLKGAFSPVSGGVDEENADTCTCLSKPALDAYGLQPDFVSIHRISGEALWVSEKSLGLFCATPQELTGTRLQNLIDQDRKFNFADQLRQCALSCEEVVHEVHVRTPRVNTEITLHLIPLQRCEDHTCQQRVMVVARPARQASHLNSEIHKPGLPDFNVSAKRLDLLKTLRAAITHYRENYETDIRLVVREDEASIPIVQLDPILLKMLLEQVFAHVACETGSSSPMEAHLSRSARYIQIRFPGSAILSHESRAKLADKGTMGRSQMSASDMATSRQLAGLLGGQLLLSNTIGADYIAEVKLPINAAVSLPAPETLAAELVHIRQAANGNSSTNPIPRKWKAG